MKKQLATLLAVTALGIGVLSGCGVSAAFADSKLNSEQRNKYHGNFHYEQQYQWNPASWSE